MGGKFDEKQLNSLQSWELEKLLVYYFSPSLNGYSWESGWR